MGVCFETSEKCVEGALDYHQDTVKATKAVFNQACEEGRSHTGLKSNAGVTIVDNSTDISSLRTEYYERD
jgi:hypothetical protein